jgi:hypothetical protein
MSRYYVQVVHEHFSASFQSQKSADSNAIDHGCESFVSFELIEYSSSSFAVRGACGSALQGDEAIRATNLIHKDA